MSDEHNNVFHTPTLPRAYVTMVQANADSAEPRGNVLRDTVYVIYRGTPLGEGACNFVDKTNSCETTGLCLNKVEWWKKEVHTVFQQCCLGFSLRRHHLPR